MDFSGVVIITVLLIIVSLLFTAGRWFWGEVWTEVVKPLFLVFLPKLLQWMIEAHKIVLTNLMPRVSVIKSLSAKYITYDKK